MSWGRIAAVACMLWVISTIAGAQQATVQNQVKIYKVQNYSAEELQAVIHLVLNGQGEVRRGTPRAQQSAQQRVVPATNPSTTRPETLTAKIDALGVVAPANVLVDAHTNSLLITTTAENWPKVKAILDMLDMKNPQVLIKIAVARVASNKALPESLARLLPGRGPATMPANGQAVESSDFTKLADVLTELANKNELEMVSRPYVLAESGKNATINVQAAGGVQAGNSEFQLDLHPLVRPDGSTQLDFALDYSTPLPGVALPPGTPPIMETQSMNTRLVINDGRTVFIAMPASANSPAVGQESVKSPQILIFVTTTVSRPPASNPAQ